MSIILLTCLKAFYLEKKVANSHGSEEITQTCSYLCRKQRKNDRCGQYTLESVKKQFLIVVAFTYQILHW